MSNVINLDDYRPKLPAPKSPSITANEIVAAIVGVIVLAWVPGAGIAWVFHLSGASKCIVTLLCAVPTIAWAILSLQRATPSEPAPQPGFHDEGETCVECGSEVWTSDDDGGPPRAA